MFALSALTSLLLLQYIARKFGDLVGRGLSWQVIGEFFLLSIPFTVAMTLPMAMLVAVLYAFSRLAAENEITALKAGGVSARSLMKPALVASMFLTAFMLWFNDQLLPQANHELAALQMAILRTKPTFALKSQVINTIKEGQLYLRAGYIAEDRTGPHARRDDLRPERRQPAPNDLRRQRHLSFAENQRDLVMALFDGMMLSAPTNQAGQLNRIYYKQDHLLVRDIANQFTADRRRHGDERRARDVDLRNAEGVRSRDGAGAPGEIRQRPHRLAHRRQQGKHLPEPSARRRQKPAALAPCTARRFMTTSRNIIRSTIRNTSR